MQAELILSVAPRVRRLANVVARARQADAEDLYQTAMLASVKHARTWQPDRGLALYAYVYRAARASMFELCARERAWAAAARGGSSTLDEGADSTSLDGEPERTIDRGRAAAAVGAALATLDDDERQLVWLFTVEERSLAEAARMTGLDYERARTTLERAMKKLRRGVKRGTAR